jgi:protein-S-isoprenylcysteine O-methyltransferase Ste14
MLSNAWRGRRLPAVRRRLEASLKLNVGTLVLLVMAAVVFGLNVSRVLWTTPRIIGVSIAVPAFLLLCVARLQLGDAFSARAKASKLVTTGLYSRIRNPIYVFGALTIAGVIVWMNQPWFFLVFALLIPMQWVRSRNEARVLEERFGAAYLDYRRQTWL